MTMSKKRATAHKAGPWGQGIVEVRHVMTTVYGVRVERSLLPKLKVKDVEGLRRANPDSDLFCVHVDGVNNSPERAVQRFHEAMAEAGLGKLFGCGGTKRSASSR
jgi:hypothetical protein